jgi:hypothetical protein
LDGLVTDMDALFFYEFPLEKRKEKNFFYGSSDRAGGIGGGMFICPGFSWLVEMQVAL